MFHQPIDGRAKCRYCRQTVYCKGNSTSALTRHAERKHQREYERIVGKKKKKNAPGNKPKRSFKYSRNSERKKMLDKKMVRFIVKRLRPINIVEDPAFKDLIKALDPKYPKPHRNTVSDKLIPEAFEEMETDVKKECQNLTNAALTTDLWSSPMYDSYNGVTLHFWDQEKKELASRILDCSKVRNQLNKALNRFAKFLQTHSVELS